MIVCMATSGVKRTVRSNERLHTHRHNSRCGFRVGSGVVSTEHCRRVHSESRGGGHASHVIRTKRPHKELGWALPSARRSISPKSQRTHLYLNRRLHRRRCRSRLTFNLEHLTEAAVTEPRSPLLPLSSGRASKTGFRSEITDMLTSRLRHSTELIPVCDLPGLLVATYVEPAPTRSTPRGL
jgi:hypothetical protein